MHAFLTSSPMLWGSHALNPANGFVTRLRVCLPERVHALFICSDPNVPQLTDGFAADFFEGMQLAHMPVQHYDVLDGRNAAQVEKLVAQAQLIVLAGGHVPTQNRFFQQIHLREALQDYEGTLIGISAGTMNSAETVYAQPELAGESISSTYQRFLPGLGLTQVQILPHYQLVKDDVLDGLRVFEDVAYPDSMGRKFYALVDGSYLLCENGTEVLHGEAYLIADGVLQPILRVGESMQLK